MSDVNILTVINKLRPKVERSKIVKLNNLVDEVVEQSSLNRRDARDFANKLMDVVLAHLKQADYVKLGEVGSLSVSCDKDQKLRVNYRASKAISGALAGEFKGQFSNAENVGLDEEGYAQRWLEQNPGDVVMMRDGTSRKR
jgi:nucleoid DNA-binding protein